MNDLIKLKKSSAESIRGASMGGEENDDSSSIVDEEVRRIKDDLTLSSYEKKLKIEEVKMRGLLGEQGEDEERVLL
jgi:hypothetical protein